MSAKADKEILKAVYAQIDKNLDSKTSSEQTSAYGIKIESHEERVKYIKEMLENEDFSNYLPPKTATVDSFRTEILDPILTCGIPTGIYRLTVSKLLRFSLKNLQKQAEIIEIPVADKDEVQLAVDIVKNIKYDSKLIPEIIYMLLGKEVANVFGVKISIQPFPERPSYYKIFRIRPYDIIRAEFISKTDIEQECQNQGISLGMFYDSEKLATKLIMYWQANPDKLRLPLTAPFARFFSSMCQKS